MFQLFSFLNSELFQSVNYESITLNTTSASTFDDKIFDVRISANIQNLRPEALLEAESIVSGLNSSETIYEGTLETGRYLRDSLPINIAFKL
jgi:hypothetical protein